MPNHLTFLVMTYLGTPLPDTALPLSFFDLRNAVLGRPSDPPSSMLDEGGDIALRVAVDNGS